MSEILTVTVNPAIDVATSVDRVLPDMKLRCGPARIDPGGGGINVARAISRFGGSAKAIIAVGGPSGNSLVEMVRSDGVTAVPVSMTGNTRQNLAVTDNQTHEQFRFSLQSDQWSASDEENVIATIAKHASKGGFVVLSGGLAPGMTLDFHRRVKSALAARTRKILIDTCDPALSHLVVETCDPFHCLRLDKNEAAVAAGQDTLTRDESFAFGTELVKRGVAQIVVIGQGAEGSLLVSRDHRLFCQAARVPIVSKIGAGDAFVGALALSLAQGKSQSIALQWGVAAASATVSTEGTSLCTREAVEALLPRCPVEEVP